MLKFSLNYNAAELCRTLITERLNALGVAFSLSGSGELQIDQKITENTQNTIINMLRQCGISLTINDNRDIIGSIKYAIDDLLRSTNIRTEKVSAYLSQRLGYSYSYLSNRFSEETYTSIENFIILRKIERVKELMLEDRYSLTEIAGNLDYSSVAHLSGQFKKVTGLTPTTFLRIIEKRINQNT